MESVESNLTTALTVQDYFLINRTRGKLMRLLNEIWYYNLVKRRIDTKRIWVLVNDLQEFSEDAVIVGSVIRLKTINSFIVSLQDVSKYIKSIDYQSFELSVDVIDLLVKEWRAWLSSVLC